MGSTNDCCSNDRNNWNACEYMPSHTAENADAPFEMAVNGDLLIEQASWGSAPHFTGIPPKSAGSGVCTQDAEQAGGTVTCELQITTTLQDSVVLSWNEARSGASLSNNCGTLTLDVYGCPEGTSCADEGPVTAPPAPSSDIGGGH